MPEPVQIGDVHIHSGRVSCTTDLSGPSPIDFGLNMLGAAIGGCSEVVERLIERLGPVLGSYPQDGEGDETEAMPEGSVVTVRLADLRAKVDRLTDELRTTLARLEV